MKPSTACLLALAFLLALGSASAAESDPAAWLRKVYDLYARAQKNEALQNQATIELIRKRASRSLAALFKRDADCQKKNQGVCALDWDFVVDGQDYELSDVKVGRFVAAGDKGTVTVAFKNMKSSDMNIYAFVRESGEWRVDDIETRPAGEKPTRIAKMLRDFKDY